ncbi:MULTISPECIES: NAD-dependent succinate-semialdehyde dehydrogenase [Halomonadaceae]|uniref:NAD-dependent succinate-semialdehyde dehydrogenase n=1 Tax=Halomonadaceae TaxID=28256 RepID=UPI0012F3EA2C|nr:MULTISPECIES: NAD-dependent succinate-semialdehyde dehydrogenase [Halomonas]CAD5262459.1 succinate-semialdehyde dehydrogenase I, NADP-dependent [Halomonas sp. 113]CAD5264256.1 succinate-semialdehyde dehydrogenase I, NADP-dependent [Halomonas sp. 59]CAD5277139.1 succinate-semialdehyde dehydrogenase I, NADP-dependent [Halomonas sp. I3]CAD5285900.1 succinate-semialdehyde dehydrogenase I, NADP-dependent [Halomonas sp. 156]VXB49624.1 succinate-semialdehyde dehydrogenase I, NADP-dependent [Halomo
MLNLQDKSLLRQQCLIDGQWVGADNNATNDVTNPANASVIGQVPRLGEAETLRAIEAAEHAMVEWRQKTGKERGMLLRRWHELMLEHQEDLAAIMTAEQGKPLAEARGEIGFAASFLEWFAEEGRRTYGEMIPSPMKDRRLMVTKQPVGVCAAITPWNFPAAMIARKAGPALAAGCTIVIKPAGQTPYSALAMGELALRAGIPAGVVNVVTGDPRSIGGAMTSSPKVRKLTFTGSTEIGKQLLRQCADTVKKVSLELGGNAPFIVFDDADLEQAIEGVMQAKFRNAGQTCVCANRIFVQDGIHDAFVERLAAKVAQLKVGPGHEAGVDIGPLIDASAAEKVEGQLRDALAKGAKLHHGGERLYGNFLSPVVIASATPDMECFSEETFGPFAPVFRFRDETEVLRLANDTEYGLAAYCYTRDLGRAWRMSEGLDYGMVGINNGHVSTCEAPFGGVKQSGQGREGARQGIEDYLETKYVNMAI